MRWHLPIAAALLDRGLKEKDIAVKLAHNI